MSNLMTGCLNSSILHFPRDFGCEYSLGFGLVGEVRVMSRITLDANSPALLGHAEDESPPVFGVEVGVGQHQETLVVFQFYVFL